jgi:hypothetical protein
MRWWLFLIAFAVTMSLDAGLMPALAVGRTVPQLWPVLLAFVAMYASRESALGAAACIGVWLDATHACMAGAWAVLEARSWLYRRNVLTLAFATVACAAFSSLAFIAIAGIRAAYADPSPLWGAGSGAGAVGADLLAALLSAAVGLVPARALQASVPYWSFAMAGPRFGNPVRIGRSGD